MPELPFVTVGHSSVTLGIWRHPTVIWSHPLVSGVTSGYLAFTLGHFSVTLGYLASGSGIWRRAGASGVTIGYSGVTGSSRHPQPGPSSGSTHGCSIARPGNRASVAAVAISGVEALTEA